MSRLFDELLRVREFDESFLNPSYEDCWSAELMPDMAKAVARIKLAAQRGEKVLIYGDYDVDGVTASTVMHDTLRLAGVKEIDVMLPNRFLDGYGMSKKVILRKPKPRDYCRFRKKGCRGDRDGSSRVRGDVAGGGGGGESEAWRCIGVCKRSNEGCKSGHRGV